MSEIHGEFGYISLTQKNGTVGMKHFEKSQIGVRRWSCEGVPFFLFIHGVSDYDEINCHNSGTFWMSREAVVALRDRLNELLDSDIDEMDVLRDKMNKILESGMSE